MHINWYQWVFPLLPLIGLGFFAYLIWQVRKSNTVIKPENIINQNEGTTKSNSSKTIITNTELEECKQENKRKDEEIIRLKDVAIINTQDRELLDLYKSQIKSDIARLQLLLKVQKESLKVLQFDSSAGGELHFIFEVFNASIIRANIGYAVNGFVTLNKKKCLDDPKPASSYQPIDHGSIGTIAVKQIIPARLVEEIRDGADNSMGIDVQFEFNSLNIFIEEYRPDQEVSYGNTLKIVETMKFHVKREDPMVSLYTWTRIS